MRLLSAWLVNFCQHVNTVVEFKDGLNAIIGPNGTGKSNAIKGIYGAISGDFKRNDGVKADNVRQLKPDGAKSYVRCQFSHGDSAYDVRRDLDSTAVRLVLDGGKPVTGDRAASDVIFKSLGVGPKLLSDHVFVDQGNVASFFAATEGDRADLCQRLFGTDIAATIYKKAGDRLDKLEVPTTAGLKDVVVERLGKLDAEELALAVEMAALPELPDNYNPADDPAQEVIRQYTLLQRLEQENEVMLKQAERLMALVTSARTKHAALDADRVAFEAYLLGEAANHKAAQNDVAAWAAYNRTTAMRDSCQRESVQLQAELEAHPPPSMPLQFDWIDLASPAGADWTRELTELESRVRKLRDYVVAATSDDPTCPTCGTPSDSLAAKLPDHMELLASLEPECIRQLARKAAIHKYDAEKRLQVAWLQTYKQRKADLDDRRKQLAEFTPPARSSQELNDYLKNYNEMERALADTRADISKVNLAGYEGQYSQLVKSRKAKLDAIGAINVNADAARDAETGLAERTTAWNTRTGLQAQIDAVVRSRRAAAADLMRIEEVAKQAAAGRAWERRLTEYRQVFHRGSAPKLAAESQLKALQEDVNDLLVRFDSDYRVEASENLSFVASFFRGPKEGVSQPAARLSGGEEVLLALAFRVAVHTQFASNLGLLCMDEPTGGLDERNLNCVLQAFDRLRELCRNTGLQVVMVTHDKRLLPSFDHVIDMAASI